jgi:hypothetical protein
MSSPTYRSILLLLVAACSKKESAPAPTPAPIPVPEDAPTFVGCPYELWPSHLDPLADGTILIAPQSKVGSGAPQYGPQQILAADGTAKPASAGPYLRRDRTWFVGDDSGSICIDHGDNSPRGCVEYELDRELAALGGYVASALDPQGRYFVMTFDDDRRGPEREFGVGFDGTGKRLVTWKFARQCDDERPAVIVARNGIHLCRDEDDGNDFYSSLLVRDVVNGKQLATIRGSFDDLAFAVIDDTHFVTYRVDTKAIEAYDLRVPSAPKVAWTTPTTFVEPSLAFGAGGVFVVEKDAPWRALMLDATTGAVRKELVIDPCLKP